MISYLKPFYFLRHGETAWNKDGILTGAQNIPLNDIGESQAFKAAQILRKRSIKHIVASPLIRATKTAEIINKSLKIEIIIVNELSECCWGEYEGQPYGEHYNHFLQKWLDGEYFSGVESARDFEKRVLLGFNTVLKLQSPVLIVSHGAVYGAMQRLFKIPPTIHIENCSPLFHRPLFDAQIYPWSVQKIEN